METPTAKPVANDEEMERLLYSQRLLLRRFGSLIGRRIVAVQPLTDHELESLRIGHGVDETPFTILLDDGAAIIPVRRSGRPDRRKAGWIEVLPK